MAISPEWAEMQIALLHLRQVLGSWSGKDLATAVFFTGDEYRIVASLGQVYPDDANYIVFMLVRLLGFQSTCHATAFETRTYGKPGWRLEARLLGLNTPDPSDKRMHISVRQA